MTFARGFAAARELTDAEKRLQFVLEQQPDHEKALLMLGDLNVMRQMWPQARDVYARLLHNNPSCTIAANNVASILATRFKDYAKAYEVAQQARTNRLSGKLLPGDRLEPYFLDTLGSIYHGWNKPDLLPEMRDLFTAARWRYPLDPRLSLYLGYAYAGLGETEQAEEMFKAAVALAAPDAKTTVSADDRKDVTQQAESARKKLKQPSP